MKRIIACFPILGLLLMSAAAAVTGLKIEKMMLQFENGRPEITVPRNYPLKAFAEIRYMGEGVLTGSWEVDGQFLANVSIIIPSGGKITIESPGIPAIPTFVSGTHTLRLAVDGAAHAPEAVFFVTADEWQENKEGR